MYPPGNEHIPSPASTFESMIYLFPRWDMLVPWRVQMLRMKQYHKLDGSWKDACLDTSKECKVGVDVEMIFLFGTMFLVTPQIDSITPIITIHVWYINLIWVILYGKCRINRPYIDAMRMTLPKFAVKQAAITGVRVSLWCIGVVRLPVAV